MLTSHISWQKLRRLNVNNLIMLVAHLWVYLFERSRFHIKSIYFTFKKSDVVMKLSIFLFTKTKKAPS